MLLILRKSRRKHLKLTMTRETVKFSEARKIPPGIIIEFWKKAGQVEIKK